MLMIVGFLEGVRGVNPKSLRWAFFSYTCPTTRAHPAPGLALRELETYLEAKFNSTTCSPQFFTHENLAPETNYLKP
jgi:hypothetical protein